MEAKLFSLPAQERMGTKLKYISSRFGQVMDEADGGETALYFLGNALNARAEAGKGMCEPECEGLAWILHALGESMGRSVMEGKGSLDHLAKLAEEAA